MNDTYFYHPDHLGSTSMVTNIDGEITQNVVYIPYGEVFVEERNGAWSSPYLFNAKELDEETGLYYYGARYLDPTSTRWLSVDPMWEKYMGMSPYNYCAGNPVKLVDLDGRENAIYVIDLQDKNKNRKDKIDTKATIKKANEFFESLGLKTRAYEVDPNKFDPSKMDATDSYVVVGSYVKYKADKRNPMEKTLNFLKKNMDPQKYNESFADWRGGGINSERTATNGGEFTKEMAIDGSGSYNYANSLSIDPTEYAAFLILHGAGHKSGFNHTSGFGSVHPHTEGTIRNAFLMSDGNKIEEFIKNYNVSIPSVVSDFKIFGIEYKNNNFINAIENRYGKRNSQKAAGF